MAEDWKFYLFEGTKWPKNQVYETHIQHTLKSSSKIYAKPVETF